MRLLHFFMTLIPTFICSVLIRICELYFLRWYCSGLNFVCQCIACPLWSSHLHKMWALTAAKFNVMQHCFVQVSSEWTISSEKPCNYSQQIHIFLVFSQTVSLWRFFRIWCYVHFSSILYSLIDQFPDLVPYHRFW